MVEAQKGVLDQSKADLDTATSEAVTTKTTLDTE
jgi:hypothetical protein